MTNDRVTIAVADAIANVTLNRPDKLNALDGEMFTALSEASAALAKRDDVRVVVVSGSGRGFCAGIDLASLGGDPSFGALHDRSYGIANVFQNAAWGWRKSYEIKTAEFRIIISHLTLTLQDPDRHRCLIFFRG